LYVDLDMEQTMLSDASVIAFIATTQPELAKDFYRDKLGLELIEGAAPDIRATVAELETRGVPAMPHPIRLARGLTA
jgi:hypothetical protein